ncbi:hypothetical protein [Xenophilus sp. Marseille-Q4582]|uniref:hypothetical protein n=1 Tax=Xenophilus sp. Marseille-Q4582 TaxID=2866600 RepID=UPI001CE45509|nr:hypothetical protein [Xenophilus sp. Marseille-Q4582]
MEPIKAGDICEVINGLGQGRSPNLGLHVKVEYIRGEHSQLGRIWRCTNPEIQQLTDAGTYIKVGWADYPASWLRKLPKTDPQNQEQQTQDQEITA